jgi:hypothetical protein
MEEEERKGKGPIRENLSRLEFKEPEDRGRSIIADIKQRNA